MTEAEWLASDDPTAMLEALRTHWRGDEADLVRLTHRYLLACCRAIWRLLPMEASRVGIEVTERVIEGRATREEFDRARYEAEGAAFYLDYCEPCRECEDPTETEDWIQYFAEKRDRIDPWVREVEAIPPEELCRLVRQAEHDAAVSPRQLLANAAYFAHSAMLYPGIRPREVVIEWYRQFLSAALLREVVGNPFRPEKPGPKRIG